MSMQNNARNLKLDKRNHVENAARSTRQQAPGDGSAKRHGGCKLMIHNKIPSEPAKFLLYQTEDGQTRLEEKTGRKVVTEESFLPPGLKKALPPSRRKT